MQGSKIRSTYIAFARKEKKRLESEIEKCQKDIAMGEKEVARVQGALATSHFDKFSHFVTDLVDRTEALSAEVLEHKKNSRTSRWYTFLQHQ